MNAASAAMLTCLATIVGWVFLGSYLVHRYEQGFDRLIDKWWSGPTIVFGFIAIAMMASFTAGEIVWRILI